MISATEIDYLTEYPHEEYNEAIDDATSCGGLVNYLADKRDLHDDAYQHANKMTCEDFELFKEALAVERMGEHDPRIIPFQCITMPEIPFIVSLRSGQFKVPFGACFIRMKDLGFLVIRDGMVRLQEPAAPHE